MKDEIYVSFQDWRTASFNPDWCLLKYSSPEAEKELTGRCQKRIKELYGENPPEQVKTRMEKEIQLISGSDSKQLQGRTDRQWHLFFANLNSAAYFLLIARLVEFCKSNSLPHCAPGRGSSSFVAYLLGITETNPLPPHKRCPQCGYAEFVDETVYESGYDLWSNAGASGRCPRCGTLLNGEGHNLDATIVFKEDGNQRPYFEICVPMEAQFPLLDFLEEQGECQTGLSRDEIENVDQKRFSSGLGSLFRVQISGNALLSMIQAIEEKTGVAARSTCLTDLDIPVLFSDEQFISGFSFDKKTFRLLKKTIHPIYFSDLVRTFGYAHGTGVWEGNAEQLIASGIPSKETIAHRDDILQKLLQLRVDRWLAYKVMESTRKGRGDSALKPEVVSLLKDKGLPEWYLDSIRKIGYLAPKAVSVECWILYLRLIWYKCNYPEAFAEAVSEVLANNGE